VVARDRLQEDRDFVAKSGYFSKSPNPAAGAAKAEPAKVSFVILRAVSTSTPSASTAAWWKSDISR